MLGYYGDVHLGTYNRRYDPIQVACKMIRPEGRARDFFNEGTKIEEYLWSARKKRGYLRIEKRAHVDSRHFFHRFDEIVYLVRENERSPTAYSSSRWPRYKYL